MTRKFNILLFDAFLHHYLKILFGTVPNIFENSLNFAFRFSQNLSSVSKSSVLKSSVSRDRCIKKITSFTETTTVLNRLEQSWRK